ncbi:MAG: hypothetical protein ABEJ70_07065 [Halobacteriaceae archaeon]
MNSEYVHEARHALQAALAETDDPEARYDIRTALQYLVFAEEDPNGETEEMADEVSVAR